ncbi:ferritin [Methanocalculus chunghsingensis]|uniref:Ferritin n=1 Tax=Methanocalculus chunghsingensis TaxID=156457 RepID=A0A8J7WAN9_9EURY|nr:ferritin [Methanocalculus chunghsingensis]MBR1369720.1 ferritin [Methanocalculus chunghsingensis]
MIGQKMEDLINNQINAELYSSYLYLSMSAWCSQETWNGFAHWMRLQAQEELSHAMKFYDYLNERGGTVRLAAIEKPNDTWASPLALFKEVYEHEQKVTAMINAMMAEAIKQKDYAAEIMLHWFVSEQVEEEANASEIVAKLEKIGDSTGGLFQLDHQLEKR